MRVGQDGHPKARQMAQGTSHHSQTGWPPALEGDSCREHGPVHLLGRAGVLPHPSREGVPTPKAVTPARMALPPAAVRVDPFAPGRASPVINRAQCSLAAH